MTAYKQPRYEPPREEIDAMCRAIKEGWNELTELARRGLKLEDTRVEIKRPRVSNCLS